MPAPAVSTRRAGAGGFADAFKNDFSQEGFGADGAGIPNKLALFLGGVAPGGLAGGVAVFHNFLRFAQQHGNILDGMESVADKEGDNDDEPGGGEGVDLGDAGIFFHEDSVNGGVNLSGADELDLPVDGAAGIGVAAGAMAGDTEGDVSRPGGAGKGELADDLGGAGEDDGGHALVGADGGAVVKFGGGGLEPGGRRGEAEFARDDFAGEVAFADEEGDDEDTGAAGGGEFGEDGLDTGLLFPEGLADVGEKAAAAEFAGVLADGRGGLVVQDGAMAEDDQGGGGKIIAMHGTKVAQAGSVRKPGDVGKNTGPEAGPAASDGHGRPGAGERRPFQQKRQEAIPGLIHCQPGEAAGLAEMAVIRTGAERTGGAFNIFGVGMERQKPFRQGCPEQRERRQPQYGGQMPGTGAIPDKRIPLIQFVAQFGDGAGLRDGLSRLLPPGELVGIRQDLDLPTGGSQAAGQGAIVFQRPNARRQPGAAVQNHPAVSRPRGGGQVFPGRQGDPQPDRQFPPIFIAVGGCLRPDHGVGQQKFAAGPGETEPLPGSGQLEQKVVPGIPAGRNGGIEMQAVQLAPQLPDRAQWPAPDMVFATEHRPRGIKGNHRYARPEPGLQIQGEGLGQQRHGIAFGGRANKRRGDHQVAHAPQFNNQQLGFHERWAEDQGAGAGAGEGTGSTRLYRMIWESSAVAGWVAVRSRQTP